MVLSGGRAPAKLVAMHKQLLGKKGDCCANVGAGENRYSGPI